MRVNFAGKSNIEACPGASALGALRRGAAAHATPKKSGQESTAIQRQAAVSGVPGPGTPVRCSARRPCTPAARAGPPRSRPAPPLHPMRQPPKLPTHPPPPLARPLQLTSRRHRRQAACGAAQHRGRARLRTRRGSHCPLGSPRSPVRRPASVPPLPRTRPARRRCLRRCPLPWRHAQAAWSGPPAHVRLLSGKLPRNRSPN